MKILNKIYKACLLIAAIGLSVTSCNKLELDPVPDTQYGASALPSIATLLNDTSFSFLKAAVTRAGLAAPAGSPTLLQQLSNPDQRFTVFAPDNNAFIASGIPNVAVIESLPVAQVVGLVSYHVVPQVIKSSSIPGTFPNFQYPSILNPNPAASALLRLTTFPSVRSNGAWVNNVPLTALNINAVNGVVHKVAGLVSPPSVDLWSKIDTDPELTYLKAAVNRADSGAAKRDSLRYALSLVTNPSAIGSNLTIFAPVDSAMKLFLTGAITKALVAQGLPLAAAEGQASFLVTTYGTLLLTNPGAINGSLATALSPTVVKGLLVYHVLSSQSGTYAPPGIRVFSVNIPAAGASVKTLLNSAIPIHPGLTVQATFVSPVAGISVVAAATVKGAANATASNIIIGRTTSDLHYVNGVIHKIDQVLLPQ